MCRRSIRASLCAQPIDGRNDNTTLVTRPAKNHCPSFRQSIVTTSAGHGTYKTVIKERKAFRQSAKVLLCAQPIACRTDKTPLLTRTSKNHLPSISPSSVSQITGAGKYKEAIAGKVCRRSIKVLLCARRIACRKDNSPLVTRTSKNHRPSISPSSVSISTGAGKYKAALNGRACHRPIKVLLFAQPSACLTDNTPRNTNSEKPSPYYSPI